MSSPPEPERGTTVVFQPTLPGYINDEEKGSATATTTTTNTSKLTFPFLGQFSDVGVLAIRPMAFLRRIWTRYYPGGAGAQAEAATCQETLLRRSELMRLRNRFHHVIDAVKTDYFS